MTRFARSLAIGAAAAALLTAAVAPSSAQSFSDGQRREIERIVKDFLLKNPEILQEVVAELEKRQAAAEAEKHRTTIASNRDKIFNSKHQVTLGNPQGDVTLVEFFDYNCGYCKRALSDMNELLKSDKNLRVVLKEMPVLGPGSIEAAQIAVAVRMQDPTGEKYLAFHQRLLTGRGQADRNRALAAAKEAGLDMARIEKDSQSAEVKANLDEVMKLAEALGINGTPSYVIGNMVVAGAVGLPVLREQIDAVRKAKR